MNDAFFFTCVKYTLSSITSWNILQIQSNPVNTHTAGGGIESVRINEVSYIKKDVKF